MTCIVGLVINGVVHLGADSCGATHYTRSARKDEKLFVVDDRFIMGGTSSFRMLQLLRFSFKPPKRKGKDVYEYMCTDFVNAVRTCFQEGGYLRKESEVESGGTFLVGYKGRLFTIGPDFQVAEEIDDWASVGSGQEFALGSFNSTQSKSPKKRVKLALEAASKYSMGVLPPFHYINSSTQTFKILK